MTLVSAPLTPSFEGLRRMSRRLRVGVVWSGKKACIGRGRTILIVSVLLFGHIVNSGRETVGGFGFVFEGEFMIDEFFM